MTKANKKTILTILTICMALAFVFFGLGNNAYANTKQVSAQEIVQETSSEQMTVSSITEQSGLGLGINVATATSIRDFKTGFSILDIEALQNLPAGRLALNTSVSSAFSTTWDESLIAQFQNSFSMGLDVNAFLYSLKAGLQTGSSFDFSNYAYKYYYVFNHNIERYNLYINNYASSATYADVYSDLYLADLQNILDGEITYTQFFDKYGTHLVGSAIYGGNLNMNISVASNQITLNSNLKTAMDSAVTFPIVSSNLSLSIVNSINSSFSTNYSTSQIQTSFNVNALGGNAFGSIIAGDFSSQYTSWVNSFNSSDANSVIVDYTSNGLIPLWSILPSEYSSLGIGMRNAYNSLCDNSRNEFLSIFKTGNYVDFAGGTGDAENPYKITTPAQLAKIGTFDMNAHYELCNNIAIGGYTNWEAIGGHYKANLFNGVFDGKYYTISGLNRTADITEVNSRIYFGLFGAIGDNGVVKNFMMTGVNIAMVGPSVNNDSTHVFVGAVAGSNSGIIQGVDILSGTVSYNCCTNGTSHVGGIAGIVKDGEIYECTNRSTVVSGRYSGTGGGIAGYINSATITDCVNYGNVTTYCTGWGGKSICGGIVGEAYNSATIIIGNCYNIGTLSANTYAWGIGYSCVTGPEIGKRTELNVS